MKSLFWAFMLVEQALCSIPNLHLLDRATTNCTQYTIKSGDSCLKIAKANNATYAQILGWNSDIKSLCTTLSSLNGTQICVSNPSGDFAIPSNTHGAPTTATTAAPVPTMIPDETSRDCGKYYLVEEGDDCSVLLAASGITLDDFLFLNPQVDTGCTNLWLGYYYCIQPVGTITTYPGYGGVTTTAATSTVTWVTPEMTTVLSNSSSTNYTSSYPVIPLADDTRVDCETYVWFANITDNEAADCWALAWVYGISGEELVLWNPSLEQETGDSSSAATATSTATDAHSTNEYAYPCTVAASTSYCVALASATDSTTDAIETPSPRANGEIANCTAWQKVEDYDTCEGILMLNDFEIDEFYYMNPAVKSDCSGMNLGTYYCISTHEGGWPPGATDFVTSTTTATEEASSTTAKATTTTTGTKTTTTGSTTTSSGTGVTTPSPVQSGMTSSCTTFYKVIKDDSCWGITQDNSIALDDFYAWNPAVGTDCAGLQADVYVCIAVEA